MRARLHDDAAASVAVHLFDDVAQDLLAITLRVVLILLTHTVDDAARGEVRAFDDLRELLRFNDDACSGHVHLSLLKDGVQVTHWQLRIGDLWSVPAVELAPRHARGGVIVTSDDGRAATATTVVRFLAQGKRVLAVDPFYFGESKLAKRDFLFALLVAAVGQRPLGIQAGQLASIARWWNAQHGGQEVAMVAEGPRSCTMALVAAAMETQRVNSVQLHRSLGSLRQVIEQNWAANKAPEMFCFGLLENYDILHLAALVTPRPITFHRPSDRARAELMPLEHWYAAFGLEHDPLP